MWKRKESWRAIIFLFDFGLLATRKQCEKNWALMLTLQINRWKREREKEKKVYTRTRTFATNQYGQIVCFILCHIYQCLVCSLCASLNVKLHSTEHCMRSRCGILAPKMFWYKRTDKFLHMHRLAMSVTRSTPIDQCGEMYLPYKTHSRRVYQPKTKKKLNLLIKNGFLRQRRSYLATENRVFCMWEKRSSS